MPFTLRCLQCGVQQGKCLPTVLSCSASHPAANSILMEIAQCMWPMHRNPYCWIISPGLCIVSSFLTRSGKHLSFSYLFSFCSLARLKLSLNWLFVLLACLSKQSPPLLLSMSLSGSRCIAFVTPYNSTVTHAAVGQRAVTRRELLRRHLQQIFTELVFMKQYHPKAVTVTNLEQTAWLWVWWAVTRFEPQQK